MLGIALEAAFPGLLVSAGSRVLGVAAVVGAAVVWRFRRTRRVVAPSLVAIGLFLVYLGSGSIWPSGDNLGTRALPVALLQGRGIDVTGVPPLDRIGPHYSVTRLDGRLVPVFPLGTPLLATPAYALFAGVAGAPALLSRLDQVERLSAAGLAALAVAILSTALRRWVGGEAALLGTLAFGLASPLASTASQGLWSFTGEIVLLCVGIGLVLERSTGALVTAGFVTGLAFLCRPTAIAPGLVFGAMGLVRRPRREALTWGAGLSAGIAVSLGVNTVLLGRPLGLYGDLNLRSSRWVGLPLDGLLGTLVSPSRGLLVWCPWIVAAIVALSCGRPAPRVRRLAVAGLVAAVPVWLLASVYSKWWGGYGTGPRLLAEASPFLAILAAAAFGRLPARAPARVFGVALLAVSAATHLLSIYRPAAQSWSEVADIDGRPASRWSLADSQLAAAWLSRWTPSQELVDLALLAGGREDDSLTGSIDAPGEGAVLRGHVLVRGWARIPGDDLQVLVRVETRALLVPDAFRRYPRPDVCSALPQMADCTRAGWEAEFALPGDLPARQLRVTAIFLSKDGRYRRYPAVNVTWIR